MTTTGGGREWARNEDGSLRWVSLQAEHLEPALQVMRESFFPHESISKALRLNETPRASAQIERIATICAQDGVSVACIEASSGRVIGVAFNKIQSRKFKCRRSELTNCKQKMARKATSAGLGDWSACLSATEVKLQPGEKSFLDVMKEEDHDPAFVEVLRYLDVVEGTVDIFEHYGVDCYMEHMFLATLTEYGGRGVGRRLVESTVAVARALARGEKDVVTTIGPTQAPQPPRPGAVMAIFTSSISQRIGSSLGWEVLSTVKHSDLYFQGEPYSARIGPAHPTSTIMGIRINP